MSEPTYNPWNPFMEIPGDLAEQNRKEAMNAEEASGYLQLLARIAELEAQVTRCQEANTVEVERRRKAEKTLDDQLLISCEAMDERDRNRTRLDEILAYLRERCEKTCGRRDGRGWSLAGWGWGHATNCPVADLGLEEK